MEEAEGCPGQDKDRDNADTAALVLKTGDHAPENLLLLFAKRHEAVDRCERGVTREEIGAYGQQESNERHQGEEGVVSKGGRTLSATDPTVNRDGLTGESPEE
jgi:hypothetical protein